MANVTSVTILGTVYKIACPPEESEAVEQAAVFLNGKLEELRESSNLDENKAAIITALNISNEYLKDCLLYTSPSPRDATLSRMPSSA